MWGSALLAVAATRESSEYEPSVVLFLIGAGAIIAVVYGVLARRLCQPSWRARAALSVVALAGAVSVATLLAVTIPLVVINVWTWRPAAKDNKVEVE